jgi:hypothetical protein
MIVCPVCRSDAAVEQTCVAILSGRDTNRTRCRRCGARGTVADWEDAAGRSDIAKCAGNGCPIRESCDRFVRPAVDRQTWLEPRWCSLPSPCWGYPQTYSMTSCMDWEPLPELEPFQPHGGAVEEGDGA